MEEALTGQRWDELKNKDNYYNCLKPIQYVEYMYEYMDTQVHDN